jgi:hypothetical protein
LSIIAFLMPSGRALIAAGHEVVLLRTQLAPNSPDPLVAAVAAMMMQFLSASTVISRVSPLELE